MNLGDLERESAEGPGRCDPALVGTLAILQSAIQAIPTPRGVASLIEAGLLRLPGIAAARLTAYAEPLAPDARPVVEGEPIWLETLAGVYGWMDLTFADRAAFAPYEPYVRNLGNAIALHLENADLFARLRAAVDDRERLLAIVSHDLRNPITSLHLHVELLERRLQGTETAERLAPMRSALQQVQRLLDDLRDVSRLQAGTLALDRRPVEVRALVREAVEVVRPIADEKGVLLAAAVEGPALPATCDPDRIQQALANLLGNAIKFTPRGGRVETMAERVGGEICVTVRDTGPGIPPESLPRIFDRFWQAAPGGGGGVGLGLAIVKGIVESHGGRIRAESVVGRGTTMRVALPTG